MSISAIGNQIQTDNSQQAMSQLSGDYDRFMSLLVAQVKHQDPLKPMEGTEFITQLAQLTQVEQAVRSNDQIESLRAELSVTGAMFETALIGREVTVPAQELSHDGAGADFSYSVSRDTSEAQAIITDASGNIIRTISDIPGKAGMLHDVSWDGLTDSGSAAPLGSYNISIASADTEGSYETYVSSIVNSIDYTSGSKMLNLENGSLVSSGVVVRAS